MATNSRVSVLIDNRTNRSADCQSALAVTALGEAKERQGEDRRGPLAHFLHKHPKLEPICLAASTSFMEIKDRPPIQGVRHSHAGSKIRG